jgi:hypothetical protein
MVSLSRYFTDSLRTPKISSVASLFLVWVGGTIEGARENLAGRIQVRIYPSKRGEAIWYIGFVPSGLNNTPSVVKKLPRVTSSSNSSTSPRYPAKWDRKRRNAAAAVGFVRDFAKD